MPVVPVAKRSSGAGAGEKLVYMSDLQLITDDSDLRKYRIELPNIIDDLGLSPYEGRLYVHYKRVCGANGGTCKEGTRRTAHRTKMSVGQVPKARDGLAEKGLIEKIESGQYVHVKIVDIWELNFAYFMTEDRPDICGWTIRQLQNFLKSVRIMNTLPEKRSPDEQKPKKRSLRERSVHTVNALPEKRSYSETKKEPINKNQPNKNNLDSSLSSCADIWPQVEAILEMRMTRASYDAVMRGASLIQENGHYVVAVPTAAAKELLENRFADQVAFAVSSVTGAAAEVQFRLQERTNQ